MSTSILKYAPAGVLGDCSRMSESNVEAIMQGSQFSGYGQPFKYDSAGKAIPFAGSETAADFKGVLLRMVPSISGNTSQGFSDTIPWLEALQGALVRGYGIVECKVGTPVRGGIVYVRVVAASPKAIGDFEATSDSSNSVALTNAEWASSGKDVNNLSEIRIRA